ncbi:MAG TPA: DNRLRE domain-containing protein, partial [Thermoanaerobaculia bacterium]|nr:DNRLRE domain-containing protein [Thermoanaerobaculia bacterium]
MPLHRRNARPSRALVLSLAGAGLGLLAFAPAAAATVQTSLPAVADATLRQQQANQNRGDDDLVRLGWAQGSRALVRFDQAAIAAAVGSGQLVSARLELNVDGTGESWGNTPQNVDAHRVTASWTEAGATWNCGIDSKPSDNKADCNPQWNGGSFVAAPTASVPHTKQTRGVVSFDVTSDVAAFLAGTANQGWLLKKANETLSGRIDDTAREGAAAQRPRLVLAVDSGGAPDTTPPSVAITAPPTGSRLATAIPTITATYSDAGSGIDPA